MLAHSQLARDYFAFLTRVDPVERWEDLAALEEGSSGISVAG
jgi:hypothetical protein